MPPKSLHTKNDDMIRDDDDAAQFSIVYSPFSIAHTTTVYSIEHSTIITDTDAYNCILDVL